MAGGPLHNEETPFWEDEPPQNMFGQGLWYREWPKTMPEIIKMRPPDIMDKKGYVPGDVIRSMIPPKGYFIPPSPEDIASNCRSKVNPMHEEGIVYRQFYEDKKKILHMTIKEGDVKKLTDMLTLQGDEDGLEINLNTDIEMIDDGWCIHDEGCETLGKALERLPVKPKSLILFVSRNEFTDVGMKNLMAGIPKTGEGMWDWKFSAMGEDITNEGMEYYADAIPQDIESLHVNMGGCLFNDDGVDSFLDALPDTITELRVNFRWGHYFLDEARWVRDKIEAKAMEMPNLDKGTLKVPGKFWFMV